MHFFLRVVFANTVLIKFEQLAYALLPLLIYEIKLLFNKLFLN
jgi:hypothetical protein